MSLSVGYNESEEPARNPTSSASSDYGLRAANTRGVYGAIMASNHFADVPAFCIPIDGRTVGSDGRHLRTEN